MKHRRPTLTVIALTALLTILIVVIYANLTPGAPGVKRVPEAKSDVRDPQFRRELSTIFGPALLDGNRIDQLENGVEIFPAMLAAIRAAKETINFETYSYWQGDIAREFADALAERARADVEVNVILDWAGSLPMDDKLVELMEQSGVRVAIYRPLAWYQIDRFNHRTHRRILVVDGRVGFTGGVGIAEEWTGDAHDGEHYRDRHFRLEGPVVAQLQAAFNENWQKCRGEILVGERYYPPLQQAGDLVAQIVTSAPGTGNERARQLHLLALAAARESVIIGTPYFVPDPLVLEALLAAAERGVAIKVLVPGRSTDSYAARFASRRQWGEMLRSGVEIYEYSRTLYHCKLLIVDGYWTLVGSTNFDSRSFRLNDEINLSVLSDSFARRQRRAFDTDLRPAKRIDYATWADRPLHHRFLESIALVVQGQV